MYHEIINVSFYFYNPRLLNGNFHSICFYYVLGGLFYSKSLNTSHLKADQKFVFKTDYRLMQVKSIAECSSILQYFRPLLSYHLSLRPLFCLFLSGRFTQILLYSKTCLKQPLKRPTIGFQDRLSLNAGQKYSVILSTFI